MNEPLNPAASIESKLRSLVKTISWRTVGTVDTMLLTFLLTGSIGTAAAIGGSEVLTKSLLYFLHERVWSRIRFGRS